jgi:phenylacetate-CoA ligase
LAGEIARWREPYEDRLRNRLRLSAYDLGRADLRGYLRRIEAFRPASIYAYSTAAYLLALEASASGFGCDSLKVVTVTGEPAFAFMVSAMQKAFGVPVVNQYGSVECGLIAGQWPDGSLRVREDQALVETLPREDGRYDIVLTVLNNPAFPLLRYLIGDATDAPLELPERGFARLQSIIGRQDDVIFTRAGRCLHPARIDSLFEGAYHRTVRCFRVHQQSDGALSVSIEPDPDGPLLDVGRLRLQLGEMVEGFPVVISLVESIPQTPAGKHRCIVSDFPHAERADAATLERTI